MSPRSKRKLDAQRVKKRLSNGSEASPEHGDESNSASASEPKESKHNRRASNNDEEAVDPVDLAKELLAESSTFGTHVR